MRRPPDGEGGPASSPGPGSWSRKVVPYEARREPPKLGLWKGKVWLAPDWDSPEVNEEIARDFGA